MTTNLSSCVLAIANGSGRTSIAAVRKDTNDKVVERVSCSVKYLAPSSLTNDQDRMVAILLHLRTLTAVAVAIPAIVSGIVSARSRPKVENGKSVADMFASWCGPSVQEAYADAIEDTTGHDEADKEAAKAERAAKRAAKKAAKEAELALAGQQS